jgi:hypothetical protein
VEDRDAAEVVVFTDLVRFGAKLGDGEAGAWCRRPGILITFRIYRRGDDLRTGSEDDAGRLRLLPLPALPAVK